MLNSGAFREERIIPAGEISLGVFMNFIKDDVVVKYVDGEKIVWLIQNSVSKFPSLSGRYFQFAGIQFVWDSAKKPYHRVDPTTIKINGQPLQPSKQYKVAFRKFIADGGDGNLILKDCTYVSQIMFKQMFMIMKQILQPQNSLLEGFKYKDLLSTVMVDGKEIVQLDLSKGNFGNQVRMINSSVKDGKGKKEEEDL